PELSREINSIMYMVNNLERMGDHCENLIRLVERKHEDKIEFSDEAMAEIANIEEKTREFFLHVVSGLEHGMTDKFMLLAKSFEGSINALEDRYRNRHIERLSAHSCSVVPGLVFIDILTNFEKIGDHCFNICETIAGEK
ncbi:MAG: Na/Pi cotransporter family protein, partial [Deltaproteobacteria bacterium]|nr:Na/Pi cotransporter family protein [Candidatus Tharpella sp.]